MAPLRISVDQADPGYQKFRDLQATGAPIARVFVDGVLQHYVITADEDMGYVVKSRRDDEGTVMVDWERDEFLTEKVWGSVVIQLYT